jgi:hypothetical protein
LVWFINDRALFKKKLHNSSLIVFITNPFLGASVEQWSLSVRAFCVDVSSEIEQPLDCSFVDCFVQRCAIPKILFV